MTVVTLARAGPAFRPSRRYSRDMTVDPRAKSGFSGTADAYARGRPSYPKVAIDRITSALGLTDESTVLDLAAGTGQLSALFRTRVRRTIAVEPAPAMRARIAADLPDVDVVDGMAEAIPLNDGGVDAVVVGEAFHWFEPSAALPEIARVLRPGGGLAMLWNSPTWTIETAPWLRDFQRTVAHHKTAAGDYPSSQGRWRDEFERSHEFEELVHTELSHTQIMSPRDFLAQVASWSWIANLEETGRQAVLDDVAALIEGQGEIVIPYRTDLYLTHRAQLG